MNVRTPLDDFQEAMPWLEWRFYRDSSAWRGWCRSSGRHIRASVVLGQDGYLCMMQDVELSIHRATDPVSALRTINWQIAFNPLAVQIYAPLGWKPTPEPPPNPEQARKYLSGLVDDARANLARLEKGLSDLDVAPDVTPKPSRWHRIFG